ncbi:hypothetical protein QVD17_10010 [Tagetes erecta]|uniref:Uncharacterized protein n=1 Tax=Tagetes erecta TaxID=13708 RepID=A0AAD8L2H9_TARER|nr:hypothetical protein QVD17_10010 [Tagetes erecta]
MGKGDPLRSANTDNAGQPKPTYLGENQTPIQGKLTNPPARRHDNKLVIKLVWLRDQTSVATNLPSLSPFTSFKVVPVEIEHIHYKIHVRENTPGTKEVCSFVVSLTQLYALAQETKTRLKKKTEVILHKLFCTPRDKL